MVLSAVAGQDPSLDGSSLPEGDEKARVVRAMFDKIAPRYDLINRLMTFKLDERWRRRTVAELRVPPRSLVLDLGCGTGDLCRELCFFGHQAIGVDASRGMLRAARTEAPLLQADALCLPLPAGRVDGATSGFALRNVVDIEGFARELARVIRPGGAIALLEVAEPPNALLRAGHNLYFRNVVPRVGGLLSDPEAYRYLPESFAYLPSPPHMLEIVRNSGFKEVRRTLLMGGVAQLVVGLRR